MNERIDEGNPTRPWDDGAGYINKSQFVSMDSLLSPSSYSSGNSKSSSNSPTTNILSSPRQRGLEVADEEIRAAVARAIHRLDNKTCHNYLLPNEISVSEDDDDDSKTNRRLFQSSNEDADIMDLSSFQSLPCRTSLRNVLPSEADRKRIVACLAITLASSYLYDDDDDNDNDNDDRNDDDQPNISSFSNNTRISSNVLTTDAVELDSADSSSSTEFSHHRHLTPSKIQENKYTKTTTTTKTSKVTRLRFSIELLHQCTHLLFLDPSHAKALEPILYIRPTPTSTQEENDLNSGSTNANKSSSFVTNPKAPTPQRKLHNTDWNRTPRQECVQLSPTSQPSMKAILSETIACGSEYSVSSPPVRLARYGLLTSPSYDVGPDNNDLTTPCRMERVDEHPLQSNTFPSSLFCTSLSHVSTDVVLQNSSHCQNYNNNYNNNINSHPEEESIEFLQKIKDGLLSSSFEQQDALLVESNTQQEGEGGGLLAQHQRQALDGFRELVLPFLSELTNREVGYDCTALLLLHYLLANPTGYDARVRFIFKRFAVVVFIYTSATPMDVAEATNRFEAIERIVSEKLTLVLSETSMKEIENDNPLLSYSEENSNCPINVDLPSPSVKRSVSSLQLSTSSSKEYYDKTQLLRTLKITTASLAAGTVFALTGGLAAPGIAAGVAALTSSGTAFLLPHGMLTTMFGVGGGGLVGYKVQRRTKGLTQFDYKRAVSLTHTNNRKQLKLHNVICLSGWIRDSHDFYRPWGIPAVLNDTVGSSQICRDQRPNDGKRQLLDFSCYAYNLSSLIQFYDSFKPENVQRAAAILQHWEGEEHELWRLLRERYGTDPFSYMERGSINNSVKSSNISDSKAQYCKKHISVLDILLEELGYSATRDVQKKGAIITVRDLIDPSDRDAPPQQQKKSEPSLVDLNDSGLIHFSSTPQNCACSSGAVFGYSSPAHERSSQEKSNAYDHLAWDYFSFYDGELYTVIWEENLLMELCDSVTDMALDIVEGQIVQILRQTALHSFMNAIALPFTLVNATNMIDETWTLTIERAEEAGKELAKSLLANQAGNKPVILLGYSMGARVIYSCLKELAKHQEKWENEFEAKKRVQADSDSKLLFSCRKTPSYPREPSSIIEDAVLMGCPNHISLESWRACRRVVAGRLINCYSRKDLVLSLMFQIKRMTGIRIRQVCGTRPVNVQGVENYDVTHLISQHSDYSDRVQDILKLIGYGQPSPSSLPIPDNYYCES